MPLVAERMPPGLLSCTVVPTARVMAPRFNLTPVPLPSEGVIVEALLVRAVLAKVWALEGLKVTKAKFVPVAAGAVLEATMMACPEILTT